MYIYNKTGSALKVIIYVTLIGIIVFLSTYIFYIDNAQENQDNINYVSYSQKMLDNKEEFNKNLVKEDNEATSVFENSIKSIVGITAIQLDTNNVIEHSNNNLLNIGSGIVVSNKGYILTNQHVAGNENDIVYVTIYNGNEYKGKTVWADMVLDLAIVKIDASNLEVANLGDSDSISLGQKVYAIGNPLGLDFQRTITEGIISALNRTIKINDLTGVGYMENLIQTDASINPGNSGGALINREGEVIGINTIKVTDAEGIGFAIPINTIKNVINVYETKGDFEEAYLGIFAYDNILLAYANADMVLNQGILVANVDSFGPLATSDIKIGDILISVDNINLNSMVELRKYLYTKKPNDVVKIKYMNKEGDINIEQVTLQKKK